LPVTRNSNWQAHLPPGVDPGGLDLLAARSLPATWRRLAAADPDRPALWAAGPGWRSRGELDVASARVAGRFQRAGLAAGDRVLVSAATSMDLVVAYLGALRMGLVVVPVNTTYREREVAHIVGDARPRAAVVDDPERGAWARRAAGGDLLVTGPEAGLPDGDPPPLDTAAPPSSATPRALPAPQGGRAGPRQPAGQRRGAPPGLALGPAGPAGAGPAPVPPSTALGSASTAPCSPGRRPCCCPGSRPTPCWTSPATTGRPCSSGCRPCTPGWPPRPGRPSWAGCGCACRGRRRCPRRCSSAWPSGPGSGCWSATA
jgi:hypothetical protein